MFSNNRRQRIGARGQRRKGSKTGRMRRWREDHKLEPAHPVGERQPAVIAASLHLCAFALVQPYWEAGFAAAAAARGFIVSGSRSGKSVTRPPAKSVSFTG